METDCVSNETIPEIATDSGAPKINEKRQIEKYSSDGTQTDFPEICHSSSFANIEEMLPKVLRVEADLSALKNHSNANFQIWIEKWNNWLMLLQMAFIVNPVKIWKKI